MNLLYDLWATQPSGTGKRHGGGKYGEIIFYKLIERNISFSCIYDSTLWLNEDILRCCEQHEIKLYDISNHSLKSIVSEIKPTLIYSALPERICDIADYPILGTIHGLRTLERPFDYFLRYHFLRASQKINPFAFKRIIRSEMSDASRISYRDYWHRIISKPNFKFITVSQHSKYSLLSQYPDLKDENIKVFYSPSTFRPGKKKEREYPYFLMVSGNRWDKNNIRGIIALDRLFSQGFFKNHKVVVTGIITNTNGLKNKLKNLINGYKDIGRYKIKNRERFIFKDYVDEDELSDLYANAYAFLYPSINEGFGYPPLEAMGNGVPVLTSSISAIPEILSYGALYFAPFSIEEIMNRILMISQEDVYKEYSQKAYSRFLEVKKKQDTDLEQFTDYIIYLAQ